MSWFCVVQFHSCDRYFAGNFHCACRLYTYLLHIQMYIRSPCSSVFRQWIVDTLHIYILNIDCSGIESHVKANFRKPTLCFPLPCIYTNSPCALNVFFITQKTYFSNQSNLPLSLCVGYRKLSLRGGRSGTCLAYK